MGTVETELDPSWPCGSKGKAGESGEYPSQQPRGHMNRERDAMLSCQLTAAEEMQQPIARLIYVETRYPRAIERAKMITERLASPLSSRRPYPTFLVRYALLCTRKWFDRHDDIPLL